MVNPCPFFRSTLRPVPARRSTARSSSRSAWPWRPATCPQAKPSVRSLADRLVIHVNTVIKAYAELVRDGVLESHQGKGFFVAEKRQIYSKAERLRRLRQAVDTFIHEAVFLDFTAGEIRATVDEKLA